MKVNSDTLANYLTKHARWLLVVNLLLVCVIGLGMKNLRVETDYRIFFAEDDPNLLADEKLKALYGRSDNILFVIDPGTGNIFSREVLSAIEDLSERAWQIPHSRRVDSLSNFQYPTVSGDDIVIDSLVREARNYDDRTLQQKKNAALNELGLVGRLVASNGASAGVNVTLNLPDEATLATEEAVLAARVLAADIESAHPAVSVYLAGIAPTEQTFSDIASADAQSLIPLMFTLVLVLLWLLTRSLLATLCTTLVIAFSTVVGMGFAGWSGMAINNVNISAPTIIMTLAIADCVHIFNTFLQRFTPGESRSSALSYSLRANIYPIFLTSVTTAFGFLTMNFSESPPFQELGTISAMGVLGALWASLFILPGLIMLLPFRASERSPTLHGLMAPFADWVIAHHRGLFYGVLCLVALAIAALPRMQLNDNPIGYFSRDTPIRQAAEFVEQKLSGTQIIYYALDAGRPDGVLEPEFLAAADKLTQWLRSQAEVANVESFTDLLKRFNQILHEDDDRWYRLPEERALAAQYFLMYALSLPYGLDPGHLVSRDKSSMKIGVTLHNQKSRGLIAFEQKTQAWMAANMPRYATPGASHSVSFAHIGQRNIESMLQGSLLAIVLISLSLILSFRSLRYGLLSFIPNLLPAMVTLGIWSALVTEVNMAASVVFSITLGIIVDDTVHFMVKYLDGRRRLGLAVEEAIRHAFATVGVALVSTSLMLALGFLVMASSDFMVNSTSGLLVAITILVAVLLDLVFLPSVLLKFSRRREQNAGQR